MIPWPSACAAKLGRIGLIFSEELHRRIIRSVGERQAEAGALRARGTAAGRRRRSAAVLAVAGTIVAAAVCWLLVPGLMQTPRLEDGHFAGKKNILI